MFRQLDAQAYGIPQALTVKGVLEVAVIQERLDRGVGRGQIEFALADGQLNPGRHANRMDALGIRMTAGIQLAVGKGELQLTSRDPKIQPLLDYRYLEDAFDRQRLREAVRLCVRLADHPSFRDIIAERLEPTDATLASDEALDAWLYREVTTSQHISCTCKMGPASDPMAVVDQYGRVHGLDKLRVVDASIMPDCIRANTNVTTMMIGERIADFIRQGM